MLGTHDRWAGNGAYEPLGASDSVHRKNTRAAFRKKGVAGVAHGNRGRQPLHAIGEQKRARVQELGRTTYRDCNDSHLTELLAEREGLCFPAPVSGGFGGMRALPAHANVANTRIGFGAHGAQLPDNWPRSMARSITGSDPISRGLC